MAIKCGDPASMRRKGPPPSSIPRATAKMSQRSLWEQCRSGENAKAKTNRTKKGGRPPVILISLASPSEISEKSSRTLRGKGELQSLRRVLLRLSERRDS